MTIAETLLIIENEQPSCGRKLFFTAGECYEAYQMAQEALLKQMPMNPLEKGRVIEGLWGKCANCQYPVSKEMRFCPRCGQAIDWSDEE